MPEAWFELESDPGLFTLLVEDFGIEGVQVEEIYDLDTVADMDNDVLGFIFLFRWIEDRRRRRKMLNESHLSVKDTSILEQMFFAHQVIPNSCATHALLSILLNSKNKSIKLSQSLVNLKTGTKGMNPEQKGHAIAIMPDVASAHNSHASPHLKNRQEKPANIPGASQTGEAYHYVSFLPIDGHLYEMDGLKPWPLDHGKITEESWTRKFSDVITERLGPSNGGGDIMFNLMAVVPDKRHKWRNRLNTLKDNWSFVDDVVSELLQQWEAVQSDPLLEVLSGNQALTVKEWLAFLELEHSYSQPKTRDPSYNSPVKPVLTQEVSIDTISIKIEKLIKRVESYDFPLQFSFHQGEGQYEAMPLQHICDYDPFSRLFIQAVDLSSEKSSPSAESKFLFRKADLIELLSKLRSDIVNCENQLKEQEDLRKKYKIDVCRRTHNYYPFVTVFLRMLAERGLLNDLVNQQTQAKKNALNNISKSKKRQLLDKRAKAKKRKQ